MHKLLIATFILILVGCAGQQHNPAGRSTPTPLPSPTNVDPEQHLQELYLRASEVYANCPTVDKALESWAYPASEEANLIFNLEMEYADLYGLLPGSINEWKRKSGEFTGPSVEEVAKATKRFERKLAELEKLCFGKPLPTNTPQPTHTPGPSPTPYPDVGYFQPLPQGLSRKVEAIGAGEYAPDWQSPPYNGGDCVVFINKNKTSFKEGESGAILLNEGDWVSNTCGLKRYRE